MNAGLVKDTLSIQHTKFFAIPNSYAREYTFFIMLLKKYAHEAMTEGEQLSLF